MNSTVINNFVQQKRLNSFNLKIPLIFFSNSYENDLISLNSKLLLNLYPDLDDEYIYVYALCDKSISLLDYNINLQEEMGFIKPIFLLLHVPESKKHMDNIKAIIYKIYYFLSIVCDIEIDILNKEYYIDQINLIKSIENIKRSYKKTSQTKIERRNSILKRNINQELSSPQIKFTKDSISVSSYDNFSDDGDCDDYDDDELDDEIENNDSLLNFDINSINSVFDLNNLHVFAKETKHIILINDESIDGEINGVNDNEFFASIQQKSNVKSSSIHYINVDNCVTYRLFLNNLKEFSLGIKNEWEDVMNMFQLFPITEINSQYIQLKSKDEWESDLQNVLSSRFKQYKDADLGESSDFILITKLSSEISRMNPSIDFLFHQKCNVFLAKLKNELTQTNDDVFISELSISSENNLEYLRQVISSQCYWSDEKKDFVSKSHENFLKSEFFSIIRALYPKNDYAHIRNCNLSILENQIKKDRKEIKKIFLDLKNKYQPPKDTAVDLNEEMKTGTNYSIRETERVKEIKVIAEAGHLQDIIPQDF